MHYLKHERPEKVSAPSLRSSKQRGERLVCLTAYDYPTARIVDEAGNAVADGETGAIEVRQPTMFAGYWNAPFGARLGYDDVRVGDQPVRTIVEFVDEGLRRLARVLPA